MVKKTVDLIELSKVLNVGAVDLIKRIIEIQLTSDVKNEYKQ